MVGRSYLLHRPPAPTAWEQTLNQQVLPVLIDAAGSLEQVVEHVAVRARARPILAIGLGVGLGVLLGLSVPEPRAKAARG